MGITIADSSAVGYYLTPRVTSTGREGVKKACGVFTPTYRDIAAPDGTLICVRVVGDAGGEWYVRRCEGTWKLPYDAGPDCDSIVTIPEATAWKFLTKRTDRATARARFPSIRIDGEAAFGEPALEMVSIMA
jgi:hypothetical protein